MRRDHRDDPPARRRPRDPPAERLAGLHRALHRAVDAGEDGRPGGAGQRRAPRPVRRALAADDLADRRVGAARGVPLNRAALEAELDHLAVLDVNYAEDEAPTTTDDPHWHVDSGYAELGTEAPGPPERDGPFERACRIVRNYEFSDDRILRGIYRRDDPLLGRDMVLEGRFLFLRFLMPVRVTDAYDTVRDGKRL